MCLFGLRILWGQLFLRHRTSGRTFYLVPLPGNRAYSRKNDYHHRKVQRELGVVGWGNSARPVWLRFSLGPTVPACVCSQLVRLFATPWTVSPPDSSVHEILQARILEWVAMPSSRGSSWPKDQPWGSNPHFFCLLHWQMDSLPLSLLGNLNDPTNVYQTFAHFLLSVNFLSCLWSLKPFTSFFSGTVCIQASTCLTFPWTSYSHVNFISV